jgi:hypothetical protein
VTGSAHRIRAKPQAAAPAEAANIKQIFDGLADDLCASAALPEIDQSIRSRPSGARDPCGAGTSQFDLSTIPQPASDARPLALRAHPLSAESSGHHNHRHQRAQFLGRTLQQGLYSPSRRLVPRCRDVPDALIGR